MDKSDETVVGYIDITPSWSALVPVFIGVLQNPKAPISAHREVEAELRRMAALADRFVAEHKDQSNVTTPVLGDPDQKES